MAKRKLRSRDRSMDAHHIIPRSRGGGNWDNMVLLPIDFHSNWHRLFINMTVEEIHQFIDLLMVPDRAWTYKDIDRLRRQIMGD